MKDVIKKKQIKGIFVSILLIVLGIFLIIKPDDILQKLIQVMGIILLLCGVIDFMGYFKMSDEEKLSNYGIMKGVLEFCIGILFIFKFLELIDIFSIIIGLMIIFINLFKLQLALNLKQIENTNWFTGVIISTISLILGIVIILDPFGTTKILVITSGVVLCISELCNIIYSFIILKEIKKVDKVVKEIVPKDE